MATVIDFSADSFKRNVFGWHCNTGGREACGVGVRDNVKVTPTRGTWHRQEDHAGIHTGTRHDTRRP